MLTVLCNPCTLNSLVSEFFEDLSFGLQIDHLLGLECIDQDNLAVQLLYLKGCLFFICYWHCQVNKFFALILVDVDRLSFGSIRADTIVIHDVQNVWPVFVPKERICHLEIFLAGLLF